MPAAGPSRTLKLTVAYDGTAYVGWQRQVAGVSIQQQLEEALERLEGAPVPVLGAGRTDAGVHALAQVASARVTVVHDPATLLRALNALLPGDVRVTAVSDAPAGFHARFDARAKRYRYLVRTGPIVGPFERRYVWHVHARLDVEAMHRAAGLLVGTHDFSAFRSSGSDVEDAVRTLSASATCRLDHDAGAGCPTGPAGVSPVETPGAPRGSLIAYDVTGSGFLRHMVRSIVGTLVEIGLGRRPVAWMGDVLAARRRDAAGPTAPAHGLFLVGVDYGDLDGDGPVGALAAGR